MKNSKKQNVLWLVAFALIAYTFVTQHIHLQHH